VRPGGGVVGGRCAHRASRPACLANGAGFLAARPDDGVIGGWCVHRANLPACLANGAGFLAVRPGGGVVVGRCVHRASLPACHANGAGFLAARPDDGVIGGRCVFGPTCRRSRSSRRRDYGAESDRIGTREQPDRGRTGSAQRPRRDRIGCPYAPMHLRCFCLRSRNRHFGLTRALSGSPPGGVAGSPTARLRTKQEQTAVAGGLEEGLPEKGGFKLGRPLRRDGNPAVVFMI